MRLNLSGVGIPFNAQTFNESLRDLYPIFLRICNFMSIEIANSPIELSFRHYSLYFFDLKLNTVSEVCNFFSHRARSSTLSMGSAHHRDCSILLCKTIQLGIDLSEGNMEDFLA